MGERAVTRKSNRRVVAVLGAVALAGSLAACSGGQPGAAAVVDGRVIRTTDVDRATRELSGVFPGLTSSAVVTVLLVEPLISAHASDAGIGVSDEQAVEALQAQAEQQGVELAGDLSGASVSVARYALESSALQQSDQGADIQQAVSEDLAAADVTVNPRFGTVGEGNVPGPTSYPWLVTAATEGS
ncbi:hypothetical protein CHO01_09340 [Cellulomonas hominis]|uniref:Lipoprotein n=1 Tax=Cellulomonas hominis TaxID=156981 RepID=A0A511FDC5_9CELL|nr:hypothetical protein [Cellulomonas hominis]NKY07409.1 hypothetical protein [Cellulomonas hominis]NKY09183.1 hypothetical protein [Cellulomonas hominis]GEL45818.1 hypothetical protein CHO01_09340 [Cellulomonas hominis]